MNAKEEEKIRQEVNEAMRRVPLRFFLTNPKEYYRRLEEVFKRLEDLGLEEKGYAVKQVEYVKTTLANRAVPFINSPKKAKEFLKSQLTRKNIKELRRNKFESINNGISEQETGKQEQEEPIPAG
jgi:hypothetical protein